MGTASLLDAVCRGSRASRVLLVGSSREYGRQPAGDAITEDTPSDPEDFYGVTKLAAELLGRQYWRQFGLDVRCSRSFNHTGPGQSPRFVCPDWAKQVAEIELGTREPVIRVGDLAEEIDFTDVRDVVRGYRAIMAKGGPGEVYNVCSGRAVALRFILDYLVGKCRRQVEVVSLPEKRRIRPGNRGLVGSHAKLTAVSRWQPEIPFRTTLDDIYCYWRDELARNTGSKPLIT